MPDEQDLSEKEEEEGEGANPGWEGGVTNSEFEDVGWMHMDVGGYVDVQNRLCDGYFWGDDYVRPPHAI